MLGLQYEITLISLFIGLANENEIDADHVIYCISFCCVHFTTYTMDRLQAQRVIRSGQHRQNNFRVEYRPYLIAWDQ